MSTAASVPEPLPTEGGGRASRRQVRAVAGVLPDGTPYYAPIGTVVEDGPKVMCHLCGGWYRSVLVHMRVHGWEQSGYRAAFGLELSQPLEGADTRHRRAVTFTARRATDPAVRAGCETGLGWARSGRLSKAAAEAARGRRQPEQRRRKTLAGLAAIPIERRVAGTRRHADRKRRATATNAARALGYADVGTLVRERVAAGASLAAISRELGLHKDWLCRHLAAVDPAAAACVADEVSGRRRVRWDRRWLPVVEALGFDDVPGYLWDRHEQRNWTVAAISAEVGMSRSAVESAMRRHDIPVRPDATRHAATEHRAQAVAARFGFADITAYIDARRAAGLSWKGIARECEQPETCQPAKFEIPV